MSNIPLSDTVPLSLYRDRNLTSRLISIANSACDVGDLDTALELLRIVNLLIRSKILTGASKRKLATHTIMTYERVWHLRHSQVY